MSYLISLILINEESYQSDIHKKGVDMKEVYIILKYFLSIYYFFLYTFHPPHFVFEIIQDFSRSPSPEISKLE